MTLSVIIPIYNVAPYLRACLESVLAAANTLSKEEVRRKGGEDGKAGGESRSTADVEIICVDDGSADGSGEMADEWGKKVGGESRSTADQDQSIRSSTCDFDFKIIHQPNAGVSAARETGFKAATGEWIWFVDGDDLLAPEALRSVVPSMRDDVDLIWVDEERVGDGGVGVPRRSSRKVASAADSVRSAQQELNIHSSAPTRDFTLLHEVPMLVMHQCVFRRTSIADVPFERFLVGEDILFATRALLKARGIVHVPAPLYGYVQRATSVMNVARNVRRTSQSIAYMRELWQIYAQERARLNPRMVKQRHTQLFYALPSEILQFRGKERRRLYREWREATGGGFLELVSRAMVFRVFRMLRG